MRGCDSELRIAEAHPGEGGSPVALGAWDRTKHHAQEDRPGRGANRAVPIGGIKGGSGIQGDLQDRTWVGPSREPISWVEVPLSVTILRSLRLPCRWWSERDNSGRLRSVGGTQGGQPTSQHSFLNMLGLSRRERHTTLLDNDELLSGPKSRHESSGGMGVRAQ